MDFKDAFLVALTLAGGGISLYVLHVREDLKMMKHDFKGLQQTVGNLREAIPKEYVTIGMLHRAIDQSNASTERMFALLGRIEGKLDQKADK